MSAKAFAQSLSNIAAQPIKTQMPFSESRRDSEITLSFGYLWGEDKPQGCCFALHPLFNPFCDGLKHLRYEVGTEFGVAWLLAYTLLPFVDSQNPQYRELQNALESLDIGYLASESNLSEEELEDMSATLTQALHKSQKLSFILGSELGTHTHAKDIAYMLGTLFSALNVAFDIIMPELEGEVHPQGKAQEAPLRLCEELPESNGNFIYIMPSSLPIQGGTSSETLPTLLLPALFAPTLGLKDGQEITLCFEQSRIKAHCQRQNNLKGTIALLTPNPHSESRLDSETLGYPYKKVEVIL